MGISKCSSTRDLVTLVDWVDDAPTIFIDFYDDRTRPGRFNCYDGGKSKYDNTVSIFVNEKFRRPLGE